MAVTIEPFADEPIVTFTFREALDEETITELDSQSPLLAQKFGAFYAVVDMRALHDQPKQTAIGFEVVQNALNYPSVHIIFVTRGKTRLGTHFPVFDSMYAALDHTRKEIAMSKPGQQSV